MARVAICTGSHLTEDAALDWLTKHGAWIEECQAVKVILLPPTAEVEPGIHDLQRTIAFRGPDEHWEDHYVEVTFAADANGTVLRLRRE